MQAIDSDHRIEWVIRSVVLNIWFAPYFYTFNTEETLGERRSNIRSLLFRTLHCAFNNSSHHNPSLQAPGHHTCDLPQKMSFFLTTYEVQKASSSAAKILSVTEKHLSKELCNFNTVEQTLTIPYVFETFLANRVHATRRKETLGHLHSQNACTSHPCYKIPAHKRQESSTQNTM